MTHCKDQIVFTTYSVSRLPLDETWSSACASIRPAALSALQTYTSRSDNSMFEILSVRPESKIWKRPLLGSGSSEEKRFTKVKMSKGHSLFLKDASKYLTQNYCMPQNEEFKYRNTFELSEL